MRELIWIPKGEPTHHQLLFPFPRVNVAGGRRGGGNGWKKARFHRQIAHENERRERGRGERFISSWGGALKRKAFCDGKISSFLWGENAMP